MNKQLLDKKADEKKVYYSKNTNEILTLKFNCN